MIEGEWADWTVIIAFPDLERAHGWYRSPAYQEILPLRTKNSDGATIIVEGVDEDYRAAGFRRPNRPGSGSVPGVVGVDEDVVAWRRHLHRNPEVSFEEHETSAWIAERSTSFGGSRSSGRPRRASSRGWSTGRPGPTVALRADIDALPIHEESGVEFASERPGAMHACGHDGHTAMLLGAAARAGARRAARRRAAVHLPARARSSLPAARATWSPRA